MNKTDSLTLCQSFGTLAAVLGAPMEELVRCPGIGDKKVRRLHDTFHEPFRRRVAKLPSRSTINNSSNTNTDHPVSTTVVVQQRGDSQRQDKGASADRAAGDGAARPAARSDDAAEGLTREGETAEDETVQDHTVQEKNSCQAVGLGKAPSGDKAQGFKGPKGLGDGTKSTARKRADGPALVEGEEDEEGFEDGVPEVTMSQLPDYGGSFMSSQPSSVLLRKRSRVERLRSDEEATISPSLAEALGDTPGVLSP